MFPICTYVIQDIFCVCLGSLEDLNVRHAERVTIKKALMTQYAKPVVKVNMRIYHKNMVVAIICQLVYSTGFM